MRSTRRDGLRRARLAGCALAMLALLLSTAEPARACGSHGTNSGNDINDWLLGDTDGDGLAEAFVGIEDLFLPPTDTTTCVCGIGLGTTDSRLPPGVRVTSARIGILHVERRTFTDLGAFDFRENARTTEGLESGAGPGGPPGTNPLLPDATWFGFAATVDPFTLPPLEPGEIFALGFDLAIPLADLPLAIEAQFAAGEGDAAGVPLFFGSHPPTYFTAEDPLVVLVPEPQAAWGLAGALVALLLWVRRAKQRRRVAQLRIDRGVSGPGLPPRAARGDGRLAALLLCGAAFTASPAAAQPCPTFFDPVATGVAQAAEISEASGMVASVLNPGVFWVHNDSGDTARVFAMRADGTLLATYSLTGAGAVDWEDMARGPGPIPGVDYLYFGDIGDNFATRPTITVYRVPEPVVDPDTPGAELPLDGAVALEMEYPDGAHDAETLLSDPITGDLFVVTKCLLACSDGLSRVFRSPFPHDESGPVTLTEVAALSFPGGLGAYSTTAGDVDPSGARIAIRTYTQTLLWSRAPGESLAQAFASVPCPAPVPVQPQGETLAFSIEGDGYSSLSEQVAQPILRIDERFGDQTLLGARMVVKDPSAGSDASRRKVVARALEKASPNSLVGDPTSRGAVLDLIANGASPSAQTFALLPGADSRGVDFWKALGSQGFRYADRRGERGPVKKVVLRRRPSGKFTLKVVVVGANGALDIVPPAPGSDGSATLRFPGGDRYCVQFGAEGKHKNAGASLWRVQGVTAEGCP